MRDLAPDETAREYNVTALLTVTFTITCQPGDEEQAARDELSCATVWRIDNPDPLINNPDVLGATFTGVEEV
jgi:hypothetical protein